MSLLRPCSICGRKEKGKNANVATSWYDVENHRHAYRQYMCLGCFAEHILPIQVADEDEGLRCPLCHIDTQGDLDPTYLIMFVPGSGRVDLELATDPACAAILRARAQVGAVELDSYVNVGLGPKPNTSLTSAWDELGLSRRIP